MLLLAFALLAKALSVSAATSNGSDIIISSSGSPITLDQCNSECASVNVVLFTTCSQEQTSFPDQMRCACSTVFIEQATECSSCCQELNYESEFQELVQVISACSIIQEKGNTSSVAAGLVYTTLFSTATQYLTATATETQVQTYTALPQYSNDDTIYPWVSTDYYTVGASKTAYTPSPTSVWSTTTDVPAAYQTTSSTISASSIPTPTPSALPTVSISTSAARINSPDWFRRLRVLDLLVLLVASVLLV